MATNWPHKVRGLLAKAQASTFPNERAAFEEAAYRIIRDKGILFSELDAAERADPFIEVSIEYRFINYTPGLWQIHIGSAAAEFAAAFMIVNAVAGQRRGSLLIFGPKNRCDLAKHLYDLWTAQLLLECKIQSAVAAAEGEIFSFRKELHVYQPGAVHRKVWRGHFMSAAALTLRRRITELRGVIDEETTALVLKDIDAIKEFAALSHDTYLRKARSQQIGVSAFYAGEKAATEISLNELLSDEV